MMKKSIAAAVGVLAMTAALDASAYTYTWNVNGVGASANGGTTIGLGSGGAGTQYHHWVDGLAPGESWSVLGSDHAMFDPMQPGRGDASAYGVGAASWCQAGGPGGCLSDTHVNYNPDALNSEGWQHTSQHILFSLTQATDVTITLSNAPAFTGGHTFNAGLTTTLAGNLIPGMTLFSGKSTTGQNSNNHTWENMPTDNTPVPQMWTNVTYLAHDANTANANSITDIYHLAAGDYTLYIGGNQANNAGGKNFALSISAAPVPVPAAVWLFGSALAGMGIIGRRKDKVAA